MSRERFLELLQIFNDNYNVVTGGDDNVERDEKLDEMINEFKKTPFCQLYSHIDVTRVRHITLSEDNCFIPFYNIEENDLLTIFFKELSKVELGLVYFEDFSKEYRDQKTKNRNNALQNKIDDVLEYAKSVNVEKTTLDDLKNLSRSLDNSHFTKRQLFEHLLYVVAHLLNNGKQNRKVANATNSLINMYFGEDITFSRETNISNFKSFTYYYFDAKGITLYHS